jgi:hypothetical protein
MEDLEGAIGQYVLYRHLMKASDADRALFLAIPERTYRSLFTSAEGQDAIRDIGMLLISVDEKTEEIVRWLK